ncbi:MAG: YcbK family protein [Hyphomicrobiaceae bacterium]
MRFALPSPARAIFRRLRRKAVVGFARLASRHGLHAAERAAAISILLFITASIVLQSAVVLVGQLEGTGKGRAVAAHHDASLTQTSPASAGGALSSLGATPADDASRPAAPRGDRLALLTPGAASALRSAIDAPRIDAEEAPADSIIAKTVAVPPALGLRADTFGPEPARMPRVRPLRGSNGGGDTSGATSRDDTERESARVAATPAAFVISPQPRDEKAKGDRGVIIEKAIVPPPAPRILGSKKTSHGSGIVKKVHFQDDTPERCLPNDLLGVLYDVAQRFGEVQVLSTFRDPDRNRRVGGAPQSFHLSCQAIDFRVVGRTAGLLRYLEARPEVGGLKRYPLGFFHIDNGARRTW